MTNRLPSTKPSETKFKLVDAGINLMRAHGYNATTVDDICTAAGLTKGGFFHYFKSKDEIAKAALDHFYQGKAKDYTEAPFRKLADPLDRVFGRLDFVKTASGGPDHPTKGCLIGVFAQELSFVNEDFRAACQGYFSKIADDVEKDLVEARSAHPPRFDFDPKSVALMYIAIVQGSLLQAKTSGSNAVLASNIEQFRTYLQCVFGLGPVSGNRSAKATNPCPAN